MVTKVQRWGNSQGLRLSKAILAELEISVGDEVEVVARDGSIIVKPIRRPQPKYDLADLVREIPAEYRAEEVDWGTALGREEW
jgi:antitoxin MazE